MIKYKSMESIISVQNVTYSYKSYDSEGKQSLVTGVEDVSLELYKGEFVAIVGHNGSGKSTLAKLLNALLLPRKGVITVNGLNTADKNNLFDVRKTVGMVFQNPDNQMVASIVEEDVAFGPENLAVPQPEIVKRVTEALDFVGMSEYAKRSPHKLSGGQKQRIAIAGAIAIQPQVLVLDESTAMLDPNGRNEVLNVAKMLNKQLNMTVVLITHFMEEVEQADRVLVMNKGRLVKSGTPKEIFQQEELLKQTGLALPRAVELCHRLKEQGLPVDDYITDENELGDKLCKLL